MMKQGDLGSRMRVEQQGFTLVELLVAMLIALIILGGILYSFVQQNSEYNYQNHRADTVQDLEFGINFITNDFRSSLYSEGADPLANIQIINGTGTNPPTVAVSFKVWDAKDAAHANHRYRRCYLYRNKKLYLHRKHGSAACDSATSLTGFDPVLENITFFRVFKDAPGVLPTLGTIAPTGAPKGLPLGKGFDSTGNLVTGIPGYTILIEAAVDAGYKKGSFVDVKGVDVRNTADKRKRVWRYIQVRPGTVVQ